MRTHPCPRCGEETSGAYPEGGLRWAICERCMAAQRRASICTEDYCRNIAEERAATGECEDEE